LNTFGDASGQRINTSKSKALIIGASTQVILPPTLAGIPVVQHVTSLGIPHVNPTPLAVRPPPVGIVTRSAMRPPDTHLPDPPSHPHVQSVWANRIAGALRRVHKIGRLPLSAMGKGIAMSAYALSTMLYHAEFAGLPPTATAISAVIAQEVGAGVVARLLLGRPQHGGFGLLPVKEHTQARHAAMASRCLVHLMSPHLLHACAYIPAHQSGTPVQQPAPPLTPPPVPEGPRPPPWVDLAAVLLRHVCPTLHPAQTLLCATLSSSESVCRGVLSIPSLPQPIRIPPGVLTHMAVALQALGPLVLAPNTPVAPLMHAILTTPGLSQAVPSLGWRQPPSASNVPGAFLSPVTACLPVRALTEALTHDVARQRAVAHTSYVRAAHRMTPNANVQQHSHAFHLALASAWRSPCDNRHKEVLWRLAVNGIPGFCVHPWLCPCSLHTHVHGAPRQHAFWDCPIATVLVAQLGDIIDNDVPQHSLWLLQPPSPLIDTSVWMVVCMAALTSMEYGRARMWAQYASGKWPSPAPAVLLALSGALTPRIVRDHIIPHVNHARATALSSIAKAVVARFWSILHDIVLDHHHRPPAGWGHLSPDHPFLCVRDQALMINLPHDVPMPVPADALDEAAA
jgi:hypothetical protein